MAAPHGTIIHGGADSLSQLPFVRAAAQQAADATIRLFGCDFSNDVGAAGDQLLAKEEAANSEGRAVVAAVVGEGETRKFECHYCCRNFPTSQALGGHQNAHKRERQHARRAHLEASLAAAYLPAGAAHVYGAMFGGYGHHQAAPMPPPQYPVWPGMYGGVARSAAYGGMPVPGMVWRPTPVGTGAFAAAGRRDEATAPAVGTGGVASNDGNNAVMSVVTTMPSCLTGGSPVEMGRSEMTGQKEGVVSLDLCL